MKLALQFGAEPVLGLKASGDERLGFESGAVPYGGITEETDPTVPDWAKRPNPPTPEEIGAVGTVEMVEITNQEIYDMFYK